MSGAKSGFFSSNYCPRMSLRSCGLLAFGLLTFCFWASAGFAASSPCRSLSVDGSAYTVCEIDLRRHAVRLFWRKPDGEPYGYLASLPVAQRSGGLVFAMNAGMYAPDYRPDGIFYVAGETAGVLETGSFLTKRPAVDFATQSGPMLVVDGRLHPLFGRSHSRKFRSGVGLRDEHTLAFVISEAEVTFSEFARLFRDRLKCDNALFLDGGSVPSLFAPALRRNGNLLRLGPMIAVYERAR